MSPRHYILALLVPPLLLLAACGSAPTKKAAGDADVGSPSIAAARHALAKAKPCCSSFADFDFDRKLPDSLSKFYMGGDMPVADFAGSRSYFLAFKLPARDTPYRVLFKAQLAGRWLNSSYVFAPSAVVLDARLKPLRIEDIQLCEYMGWTNATSGAFGGLEVKSPAARYLVVYSSAKQLNSSTYWEQSPTAFSTEAPISMTSTGSFQIPHGPDGALSVGMLTDRYRSAIDDAICGKPQATEGGVLSTLRSVILPTQKDGK